MRLFLSLFLLALPAMVMSQNKIAGSADYLSAVKTELQKEWPKNRTINLVFHGHSVPAGFFKTPVVNTLAAYPYQILKELKAIYPFAVINIINTSIGGENSEGGNKRFKTEVLVHQPDILFIDYALNDRGIGLKKAKEAWSSMIKSALKKDIKIILLTPSPDQRVDILELNNVFEQHSEQIKRIAMEYEIGLIDSYSLFKKKVIQGESIAMYMSQVNHPNELGHQLVTAEILKYFH
ncbi:MAG: SGNH/GDSL hydrolase family protein [Cyclobacteriaceae bacterium]|jgi:acyl-CoA thioesterase I|nr:SGNH/GDSL hydrolase family protein [Cyclobacteriaceae bacterium]